MDELNLAQDEVVQRIENALDTDQLIIEDPGAENGTRVVKKHPRFQLFATQNPTNGKGYTGKRSPLSKSFIDRFQCVVVSALPSTEWVQIVHGLLPKAVNTALPGIAQRLVDLHEQLQQDVCENEEGPHSEITIREMLKCVSGLRQWPEETSMAMLAEEIWLIYVERFLTPEARKIAKRCIAETLKPRCQLALGSLFR